MVNGGLLFGRLLTTWTSNGLKGSFEPVRMWSSSKTVVLLLREETTLTKLSRLSDWISKETRIRFLMKALISENWIWNDWEFPDFIARLSAFRLQEDLILFHVLDYKVHVIKNHSLCYYYIDFEFRPSNHESRQRYILHRFACHLNLKHNLCILLALKQLQPLIMVEWIQTLILLLFIHYILPICHTRMGTKSFRLQ